MQYFPVMNTTRRHRSIADRIAVLVAGRLVRVHETRETKIADLVRDMGAVSA